MMTDTHRLQALRRLPPRAPGLLLGLGLHHVLGIHHVRDDLGAPLSWDLGFLVAGALLVAAGVMLHVRGVRALERVPGHGTRPVSDDADPGSPTRSGRSAV